MITHMCDEQKRGLQKKTNIVRKYVVVDYKALE